MINQDNAMQSSDDVVTEFTEKTSVRNVAISQ